MKSAFLVSSLILAAFLLIPSARSTMKLYYSGEVINYNGKIVLGTVNKGVLELFKLQNNIIYKTNVIQSDNAEYPEIFDLLFSKEDAGLYVYVTNGKYLYKYNISNDLDIKLVKKLKDNSNDNFYGLSRSGDFIVTIGTKGVKLWNNDLQVTNSYDVHSTFAKNIKVSGSGNYIFDIVKDDLKIIDGFYRDVVREVGINIRDDHVRNLYNDTIEGTIYVVDDSSLKKIFFDGYVQEFKHISTLGYDADGLDGRDYMYFSDGMGVVKMGKSSMKPLDWIYTTQIGPGNGWAMGIRTVSGSNGDIVIVFNGTSILALDQNLNLIDYYEAGEFEYIAPEPLTLTLSSGGGWRGDRVTVKGSGFGFNEEIEIQFGKDKWMSQANQNGQFSATINVPDIKTGINDIKATGQTSALTYSTTFEVYE